MASTTTKKRLQRAPVTAESPSRKSRKPPAKVSEMTIDDLEIVIEATMDRLLTEVCRAETIGSRSFARR